MKGERRAFYKKFKMCNSMIEKEREAMEGN